MDDPAGPQPRDGPRRAHRPVPVPRPGSGRSVRGVVRRGVVGCGHRGSQDSAALSAGELLRRTRRVDRPNRAHRPDADLRRAAPPQDPRRVCRATTPGGRIALSCVHRARSRLPPSRATTGSGVDRSSAGCSTSTSPQPETADERPWPSSGTRQGSAARVRRGVRRARLGCTARCVATQRPRKRGRASMPMARVRPFSPNTSSDSAS